MSKEKQIEEIKHDIFAAFGGYEKWEEDWQSLAEAVYNAGYRKREWISVEERLPDEAVRVLVWLREPSAILRFVQFDTDRMVDGRWVRWNNHITHWMPLTEAPKEKGGAE